VELSSEYQLVWHINEEGKQTYVLNLVATVTKARHQGRNKISYCASAGTQTLGKHKQPSSTAELEKPLCCPRKCSPPISNSSQKALKVSDTFSLARVIVLFQTANGVLSLFIREPLRCGREIWKYKPVRLSAFCYVVLLD
jgi:hypothetical protein